MLFQLLICLLHLVVSSCDKEDRRNSILSALEKATSFLEDQYDQINRDGVLGFCVLQAYLSSTVEKWDSEPGVKTEQERVKCLEEKVLALVEKATHSLAQKTPGPYREIGPLLSSGFWKVPHRWSRTNTSLAFSQTNGSCLCGEMSDYCITQLLGTRKDDGESCIVPVNCRTLMMKTHCSDYNLSHQLLYFLIAEMKGCLDHLFLDAQYYKDIFCNLMMQINVNKEHQALLNTYGDLFTENIFICGLSGFSDFYKSQWLDLILSWQKPEKGCFWMYGNEISPEKVRELIAGKSKRVKREDKILEDGCSFHNTAMAVAAIGGFLYYGF